MDYEPQSETQGAIASYLNLRRGVGIIGTALPFVLLIGYSIVTGHFVTLRSISGYYYTDMRNILVGSMCATGVFLLSYRYDRLDNILSAVAGVCAIGVGLFPTKPSDATGTEKWVGNLHLVFATIFFLALAYFCFFLFTRSDRSQPRTGRKLLRDTIYRTCGVIILVSLIAGVVTDLVLPDSTISKVHPAFWCESLAIIAFGVAWFIKGETLFKDQPGESTATTAA
jgi:hypothetical protein